MASTYTPEQLDGAGIVATQGFTAGTPYTLTITNKATPGSCYLTLSATFLETAPRYFSGSTFTYTNITDVVLDEYGNHFAGVIEPQGTSSIVWTPAITIPSGDATIQATGNIGLSVTP